MIISSLALTNFRNYQKKTFSFSPDVTIIAGKNASGKTNLMEAIYLLSLAKSFRQGKDNQAISFEEEMARIKGEVKVDGEKKILEAVVTRGEVSGIKTPLKKLSVNGVGKRAVDFTGILKTVLFWPEDMELVTDSPSLRRRYLDTVLVQIDREYRRTLLSYERGVRQRNRLLEAIKDKRTESSQLLFWNQLLIKQGSYLTNKREELIGYINEYESEALDKKLVSYQLFYDKSVISEQRLLQYRDAEIGAGVTLVGPHRDDIVFKKLKTESKKEENGDFWELSIFGSRGEQRLAVLWLKLAELSFIKEKTSDEPVLLLDDIFSELDREHREIVFQMIGSQQSILTITDKNLIPTKYLKAAKVIELDK